MFYRKLACFSSITTKTPRFLSSFVTPPGGLVASVANSLEKYGVSDHVARSLAKHGINDFYPIQTATFAPIKSGQDIIAKAQTGTGKTLAFLIPTIERLNLTSDSPRDKLPKALILAPTRELATQISTEIEKVSSKVRHVCIHGGVSYTPQVKKLSQGVDIVVGTPGRTLDMLKSGNLSLSSLECFILDECDHMLDIGFKEDLENVLQFARSHKESAENSLFQVLLFSATMPTWVSEVAQKKFMSSNTSVIDLVGNSGTRANENIKYFAMPCTKENTLEVLIDTLRVIVKDSRCLIFTETKAEADTIANDLRGYRKVAALHSNLTQAARDQIIKEFRSGKVSCLVATDIAARGIDIPAVDFVIQVEIPQKYDQFLHKSGRTGRANRAGTSITLYNPLVEEYKIRGVEKICGVSFERIPAPSKEDTINMAIKTVLENLESVDADGLQKFENSANTILKEMKPDVAVAALLSLCINAKNVSTRSLITGEPGKLTLELKAKAPQTSIAIKEKLQPQLRKLNAAFYEVDNDRKKALIDVSPEMTVPFKNLINELFDESVSITNATQVYPIRNNRFEGERKEGSRFSKFDSPRRDGVYRRSSHSYNNSEDRRESSRFGKRPESSFSKYLSK